MWLYFKYLLLPNINIITFSYSTSYMICSICTHRCLFLLKGNYLDNYLPDNTGLFISCRPPSATVSHQRLSPDSTTKQEQQLAYTTVGFQNQCYGLEHCFFPLTMFPLHMQQNNGIFFSSRPRWFTHIFTSASIIAGETTM